ncbi:hypothetical protein BU26DRAFT_169859 [Trematosphaeria pertusa]|uniref:Uncharacterized protein n=1 Tax=Trematosphaeria pertusa TaxID=390896 RepID=A0A6A6HV49_9PLEO|nr:uncharacterized protein BU26DRAFT_169859 [Trematosphaeria pertusa]KAF2241759.1 hypothetical protein BU26DRAFT_169859 [Trematosphaeria pertusa]
MPPGDETEATGEYIEISAGEPRSKIVGHPTADGMALVHQQEESYLSRADSHAAELGAYRKLSATSCLFIYYSNFCGFICLSRTSITKGSLVGLDKLPFLTPWHDRFYLIRVGVLVLLPLTDVRSVLAPPVTVSVSAARRRLAHLAQTGVTYSPLEPRSSSTTCLIVSSGSLCAICKPQMRSLYGS